MKKEKNVVVPQEPRSRLTPAEVQQQQFRRSFRGYDEQEIDDFLDRVTEDIGALLEENGRLKEQARHAPTTPVGGAAEAAEADAILRDARARADAIIKEAQARAAALGRGEVPVTSGVMDEPEHLSRFVTRERGFLQDLAGLIQSHAERVKQMVQEARAIQTATAPGAFIESASRDDGRDARAEPVPAATSGGPAFPPPPSFGAERADPVPAQRAREPFGPAGASAGRDIDDTAEAEVAVAGTAEAEEDASVPARGTGMPEPEPEADPARVDMPEPPRRVVEVPDVDTPATVTIGAGSESDTEEGAARERRAHDRDSSLSELFWGED